MTPVQISLAYCCSWCPDLDTVWVYKSQIRKGTGLKPGLICSRVVAAISVGGTPVGGWSLAKLLALIWLSCVGLPTPLIEHREVQIDYVVAWLAVIAAI